MDQANPFIILLLFVVRCLVPLLIMLGVSYVLRRLGLIREPPPPPNGDKKKNGNPTAGGGLAHGKV